MFESQKAWTFRKIEESLTGIPQQIDTTASDLLSLRDVLKLKQEITPDSDYMFIRSKSAGGAMRPLSMKHIVGNNDFECVINFKPSDIDHTGILFNTDIGGVAFRYYDNGTFSILKLTQADIQFTPPNGINIFDGNSHWVFFGQQAGVIFLYVDGEAATAATNPNVNWNIGNWDIYSLGYLFAPTLFGADTYVNKHYSFNCVLSQDERISIIKGIIPETKNKSAIQFNEWILFSSNLAPMSLLSWDDTRNTLNVTSNATAAASQCLLDVYGQITKVGEKIRISGNVTTISEGSLWQFNHEQIGFGGTTVGNITAIGPFTFEFTIPTPSLYFCLRAFGTSNNIVIENLVVERLGTLVRLDESGMTKSGSTWVDQSGNGYNLVASDLYGIISSTRNQTVQQMIAVERYLDATVPASYGGSVFAKFASRTSDIEALNSFNNLVAYGQVPIEFMVKELGASSNALFAQGNPVISSEHGIGQFVINCGGNDISQDHTDGWFIVTYK